MSVIAIASRTIEDEVKTVIDAIPNSFPILWVESGLQNSPTRLRDKIQSEIDRISGADDILLLFGYCGNCMLGLKSEQTRLIVPKVDDCIGLLLGMNAKRDSMSYYLTNGWLKHESDIGQEFSYSVRKFGQEKAVRIFEIMMAKYSTLKIIDTGSYDVSKTIAETNELAVKLGLGRTIVEGSLDLIWKAFLGKWDNDFVSIPVGKAIGLRHLGLLPG